MVMGLRRRLAAVVMVGVALLASGCDEAEQAAAQPKPELLIYCGITMVHPMKEIATLLEQEKNVRVTINQGGSEDLYQSLKASRAGDLYLPGSPAYREKYLPEGLLGDAVPVGFNIAALMVPKGNPKHIPGRLESLADPAFSTVVVNPEIGSIGKEMKGILDAAGLYDKVVANSVFMATDSRTLNHALKDGKADVILNWRATAFFPENAGQMDIIDLSDTQAQPKKLVLSLLTFSPHPDLARRFMDLATSEQGQAIFRRYGFMDASGKR